ncbi:MAG TPA: hypothetical protein VFS20_12445 [Longimicrobium sp.]|nr:hypothetical protein [Longimicrobium sp.]
MQTRLALNIDQLRVESFETAPQTMISPEQLLTCMQTDCGRIRCCA